MIVGLAQKSDAELEDMLLDLSGRHELSDEEVELFNRLQNELEQRVNLIEIKNLEGGR